MPGGDRTGPRGFGPMTGRQAGYCTGYPMPGYANPAPGRSWFGYGRPFGSGRGFGRGWRHWQYPAGHPAWSHPWMYPPAYGPGMFPYEQDMTPKQEMHALREQADILKKQLEEIQSRISTLEKVQVHDKK
jgi:hypothetical protein